MKNIVAVMEKIVSLMKNIVAVMEKIVSCAKTIFSPTGIVVFFMQKIL